MTDADRCARCSSALSVFRDPRATPPFKAWCTPCSMVSGAKQRPAVGETADEAKRAYNAAVSKTE